MVVNIEMDEAFEKIRISKKRKNGGKREISDFITKIDEISIIKK